MPARCGTPRPSRSSSNAISRRSSGTCGGASADDLTAETFTRAFAGRAGYDPARPDARPWLFGIATNVLRAHHRDVYVPGVAVERAEVIDADDRLDAAARLARHSALLRALPLEQREVLLLVAVAELPTRRPRRR